MATSICTNCISRLHISSVPPTRTALLSQTRSFTTTNSRNAQIRTPKPVRTTGTTLRLGKNRRVKSYRVPEPGERKAARKRVVLSNTNAFEVDGISEWNPEEIRKGAMDGTMLALPGQLVDRLRAIESFKARQGWGFFRRPACLVTKQTVHLTNLMREAAEDNTTLTRTIIGERGAGKSVMLLQAQASALMDGWIVIHFPEAQDLTSNVTAYEPVPHTNPTQYVQKTYTSNLLSQIIKANATALSKMQVTQEHPNLPIPLQQNMSLDRLAQIGADDPAIAWPIFQTLWTELTISNKPEPESATPTSPSSSNKDSEVPAMDPTRPPILLTLDGLAHISRFSQYLSPSMHFIHAHDLTLISHFTAYHTGSRSLPNGGAVFAADSASNRPLAPALDLAVSQSEALQSGASYSHPLLAPPAGLGATASATHVAAGPPAFDPRNPYVEIDERAHKALCNVPVVRMTGFDKDEARTLLEYYAKSGMLRRGVTEDLVNERWAIAGGGIVGELERASVGGCGL